MEIITKRNQVPFGTKRRDTNTASLFSESANYFMTKRTSISRENHASFYKLLLCVNECAIQQA